MSTSQKTILITGASAGIGKACANLFAQHNYNLILVARRAERLQVLKEELTKQYSINIHTEVLDVRNNEDVESFIKNLPEDFKNLNALVNNAGLAAGLTTLEFGEIDNWNRMIDTNLKGLAYMSKACIPLLKGQMNAHIINIGSIAGKEIYMNGNIYCASKHAVDALTKSMRLELSEYPIKVTGVHPGAVETEFSIVRYDGDEEKAKKVYEGYDNLLAEDIADAVYWAVSRPSRVNINDIVIMPTAQPKAGVIHKKQL
jgi:3-hydroxy acid dehydrogenase/malonic semialdehyde reductase